MEIPSRKLDCIKWLERHRGVRKRFCNKLVKRKDWDLFDSTLHHRSLWAYYGKKWGFFWKFPTQSRIILEDFAKQNFSKLRKVVNTIVFGKSKIIYIVGARGEGKTCLAFYLAEMIHSKRPKYKIYAVGEGINKIYPEWIGYRDRMQDVPNNSFIILDEAAIRYAAREFYKDTNILLGKYLAIARHKGLSVLFITQHVGLIDINITRLRDIVIWKKSNDYSLREKGARSGRKEKQFWDLVRWNMQPRQVEEALFEYPAKKKFIKFRSPLPSFWTEKMSTLFSDFQPEQAEDDVKDKKKSQRRVITV